MESQSNGERHRNATEQAHDEVKVYDQLECLNGMKDRDEFKLQDENEGPVKAKGQVDAILEQLGPLGLYAMVQCGGIAICLLTLTFQLFAIVFVGIDVDFACNQTLNVSDVPDIGVKHFQSPVAKDLSLRVNMTTEELLEPAILGERNKCHFMVAGGNTGNFTERIETCENGITYFKAKDSSLVSEFDLVCDKKAMVAFSQTLLSGGQGLGSILLPPLADRWGRRSVHVSSHLVTLAAGLTLTFAPNYLVFAVAKVVVGIGIAALRLTFATVLLEQVPARYRSATSTIVSGIGFSLSTAFMALVAYVLRFESWRTLQLTFTSVCLTLIPQFFILDEPLRWLVANNKRKKAVAVVTKAARWNRRRNVPLLLDQLNDLLANATDKASLPMQEDTVELIHCDGKGIAQSSDAVTVRLVDILNCDQNRTDKTSITDECGTQEHINCDDRGTKELSNFNTTELKPGNRCIEGWVNDCGDVISESAGNSSSRNGERHCRHSDCFKSDSSTETAGGHSECDTMPTDAGTTIGTLEPESSKPLIRKKSKTSKAGVSFIDVLKHRRMRINIVAICLMWFVNAMTYFGLYLTSSSLVGNLYVNFFLNAIVEIPSCVVYLWTLERFGRRHTLFLFQAVTGSALISSGVCRLFKGDAVVGILSTVLSLIGKFGATGSLNVTLMYTGELFPTNCRNKCLGVASAAGRVGSMIAPFATLLAHHMPWAPGAIFGSCSILVMCLLFCLPETKGRELPQTVRDLDSWYHKKTRAP